MSRNKSFELGDTAFETRHQKDVILCPKSFRSILVLTASCSEDNGVSFPRGKAAGA